MSRHREARESYTARARRTTLVVGALLLPSKQPLAVSGSTRRYRFPQARARQLALTKATVTLDVGSICNLIEIAGTGEIVRKWLVERAPGLGPKQASMFVRNVGLSYDLAILDRHVLNYMTALDISPTPVRATSSLIPIVLEFDRCPISVPD